MVKFPGLRKRGRRVGPKAKAQGRRRKANINARRARLATLGPAPRRAAPSRPVVTLSGLQTYSNVFHGSAKRLKRGLTQLGAPMNYVINKSGSRIPDATTWSGRQDCILTGQWNSVQDIMNLSSLVPFLPSTAAGGAKLPTRFHVKSLITETTFQNPSSGTLIYDIYDIVAKKDIPQSTVTTGFHNVYDPVSAWQSGMINQDTGPVVTNYPDPINYLGAKPSDSQLFKDYYRVIKKTSLVLQQNATHVHKVTLKIDRNFDLNLIGTQVQYLNGLAGFTHYTMVVMRGMPTACAGAPPALDTTTVPPSMRWVVSENYQFSYVQAQGAEWYGNYYTPFVANSAINALQLNNPSVGSVIVS